MLRYSHAGGIVVRMTAGQQEYLLVESRRRPGEWVLPKGHIEAEETAEAAAVREVEEEGGVRAAVVAPAAETEYAVDGHLACVIFFLMQYQGEGTSHEDRALRWCRFEEALDHLGFEESRRVLTRAHALTSENPPDAFL